MKKKIFFVDDDKNILSSFRRQFYKDYEVHVSDSPHEGLNLLKEKGPFAVIVSDMRMPAMDGVAFLSKARDINPDSVRIILTGHADMDSAVAAVNKGQIFRFLTKPCPKEELGQTLEACVKQYSLIHAEKELLQGTLKGSIKVLSEVLSLSNPEAFGRASRVQRIVKSLARILSLSNKWHYELGAMLSQIGCVSLSPAIIAKLYSGIKLTGEERRLFDMHPQHGKNLLYKIPRMNKVAEMISYQEKHFDGSGSPQDQVKGEEIPLGARILKVALDFDLLDTREIPKNQIFKTMSSTQGIYDPVVLGALKKYLGEEARYEIKLLPMKSILPGMIFGQEIRTDDDILLIAKGQEVNRPMMFKLKNFVQNHTIHPPFKMLIALD